MNQPTAATLEPQILTADPLSLPPQRRLIIFLLLALAALLHVATAGWGPIGNGADGMNAAIARELALGVQPAAIGQLWHEPIHPTPVQWITAQSFRIFEVNDLAARLPCAIANLLVVALVFLTAERLGGFWRGLSSGLIATTLSGTILHGRDGGGAALSALLLTLSCYAALRMLEQKSRGHWQLCYWMTLAALLTLREPVAALLSLASGWVAFLAFREARLRLRQPWWIAGSGVFLAVLGFFFHGDLPGLPTGNAANLARVFWTLFPWSCVLLLPGIFRFRKVLRLNEMMPAEAVLWSLFGLASLWALFYPKGEPWAASSAVLCPIFAQIASLIWERTSSRARLPGIALLIALALGGMFFSGRIIGREWLNLLRPIWWLSCGVIIVFGISAMIALFLRHSRAALLTIAASTIPLAFNLVDARARYDWSHALRHLGKLVEIGYTPQTRIYLDGDLEKVGSFLFYAPHGLTIHPIRSRKIDTPAENDYLLISREHAAHWQQAKKIGENRTHVLFSLPKLPEQ